MRLIDAERLMYSLRGNVLIDVVPELEETIAQQPTAFDKERVIKELEYDKEISQKYSTGLKEQGHIEAFDEAISIIKKGGIK